MGIEFSCSLKALQAKGRCGLALGYNHRPLRRPLVVGVLMVVGPALRGDHADVALLYL